MSKYRVYRCVFLGFLTLCLIGCAAVPQEPFQAFGESTLQLHEGTDSALDSIDTMSETRFLREALEQTQAGDPTKIFDLRIEIDPNNSLAWQTKPLFLKIEQFRDGMRQATSALVSYSELLTRLASPELLPKETFDKLTDDLNANAFDAISKVSDTPPDAGSVALFSTVAAEAARAYLESRRQGALFDALKENQAAIDDFTDLLQAGVKIAATITAHEYDEQFQTHFREMVTDSGVAPEAVRRNAIVSLIDLDRAHIDQLTTFSRLHQAFDRVPGAHRNLTDALSKPGTSLTSVIALLEEGKRLEANYDRAVKSNRATSAQTIADMAIAQARVLEAEADAAALRASAATVDAIRAQAEAEADPDNVEKTNKAKTLSEQAEGLETSAEQKKANAAEARRAADDAQRQANEIKQKLLGGGT